MNETTQPHAKTPAPLDTGLSRSIAQFDGERLAAIATLTCRLLEEPDTQRYANLLCATIARLLRVDLVGFFQLDETGARLLLTAGTGWSEQAMNQPVSHSLVHSLAGHSLTSPAAIMVGDVRHDVQFTHTPALLTEHQAVSGVSVGVGKPLPTGVLQVFSRQHRLFDHADVKFVVAAAALLSKFLEQQRVNAHIRRLESRGRALLDALEGHAAIIDPHGTILFVNQAWRRFAMANDYHGQSFMIGDNYLSICDSATGDCSEEAIIVARGIRQVIAGRIEQFELIYPCHAPRLRRWFRVTIRPVPDESEPAFLVLHHDVTAQIEPQQPAE